MVTHSGVLAWRIPWTEELGGLQSIVSKRVVHDWSNLAVTHTGWWQLDMWPTADYTLLLRLEKFLPSDGSWNIPTEYILKIPYHSTTCWQRTDWFVPCGFYPACQSRIQVSQWLQSPLLAYCIYLELVDSGYPRGSDGICLQCGRPAFDPWVRKIPWRREWQPTPIFLPGELHGQRSLVGYSP